MTLCPCLGMCRRFWIARVDAAKQYALERRVSHHDNSLAEVIDTIRALMAQLKPSNWPIGFTADVTKKSEKR